jgi:hypothetical protein
MSNVKPHDPRSKTSIIVGHMASGDWRNAIRVASRLPRLDKHRCAILDAQGAYENPRFYTQIGKDAETLIEAGAAALCERFGHNQESTTMTIGLKNYSNASNARRAAKSAGLSQFDVYKDLDGWYKIRTGAQPVNTAKPAKAANASIPATALFEAKRTKAATDKAAKAAKPRQMVDESARDKSRIDRILGKRATVLAAAQAGKLPPPPDFWAPTHARYRDDARALVNMAEAEDIEGLKAMVIKPYSSSPKAMAKYRDLAVIALEARRAAEPEAAAA